jgi:hypothetical protein
MVGLAQGVASLSLSAIKGTQPVKEPLKNVASGRLVVTAGAEEAECTSST